MEKLRPKRKLTYKEFLAWSDEDTFGEWVDGKVIIFLPASFKHQQLRIFFSSILSCYVAAKDLGMILDAPFQMYLENIKRGREPDILFILKENLNRLNTTYLSGPADLVIEITSPDSKKRDLEEKLKEYESVKIKEYWIIDITEEEIKFYFYVLEKDRFVRQQIKNRIYYSKVIPGFWININWFKTTQLPKITDILKELKII